MAPRGILDSIQRIENSGPVRGLLDFIAAGPQRRAALDEKVGDFMTYITPPNLRPAVEMVGQMNPVQGMSDSMAQFGVAIDPSQSPEARRRAAAGSALEAVLAIAPAAVASRGYMTPAQGLMESILGGSPATKQIGDDLGRFWADEAGAFKLDNPGGRWLEGKIANAGRDPARLEGSVTGYFDNDFQIPVRNFAYIDGARGEMRVPGEAQYDILMDKVKREGWNPTPISVGINDRGRPYVIEGNTRLAVARELGIDTIPAEVRYWNGGEANAPTRWTPEYLERFATPTLPTPRNDAEAMARDILDLRAAGRASEVTDAMMAKADPQYMFAHTPLPMDTASRMARAQEMGFDTDLFASSLKDLDRFRQTGKFMGHTGTSGISASDSAEAASRYLDRYGEMGWVDGVPNQPFAKNVMPLSASTGSVVYRSEPYQTTIGMGYPLPEGYIPEHVLQGYDTAVFADSISRKGAVKHSSAKNAIRSNEYVMSDPANIRSKFARFDPAFKHLGNLSAGVAGIGLLDILGLTQQQQQQGGI